MIRYLTLLVLLIAPASAHACMIVPSAWDRLAYPITLVAIGFIAILVTHRICIAHKHHFWKIPLLVNLAVGLIHFVMLVDDFNLTGAVDCGYTFGMVAGQFVVLAVALFICVVGAQLLTKVVARFK